MSKEAKKVKEKIKNKAIIYTDEIHTLVPTVFHQQC